MFSLQPNSPAQATPRNSPTPEPSACCSWLNTGTSYESFSFLWNSSEPLARLWCTPDPISTRATHQCLQQQPGSLQCAPTDPISTSSCPPWCTKVCFYHRLYSFFCGYVFAASPFFNRHRRHFSSVIFMVLFYLFVSFNLFLFNYCPLLFSPYWVLLVSVLSFFSLLVLCLFSTLQPETSWCTFSPAHHYPPRWAFPARLNL